MFASRSCLGASLQRLSGIAVPSFKHPVLPIVPDGFTRGKYGQHHILCLPSDWFTYESPPYTTLSGREDVATGNGIFEVGVTLIDIPCAENAKSDDIAELLWQAEVQGNERTILMQDDNWFETNRPGFQVRQTRMRRKLSSLVKDGIKLPDMEICKVSAIMKTPTVVTSLILEAPQEQWDGVEPMLKIIKTGSLFHEAFVFADL